MSSFSGTVWRYIPEGGDIFNFYHVIQADGRWNRPGKYGALYTSLSKRGSLGEFVKLRDFMGKVPMDYELVKLEVDIDEVLDLTDGRTRRRFGIDVSDITADSETSFQICRSISDYARDHYIPAIKSPSAAISGEENLNIYPWGDWRRVEKRRILNDTKLQLNY